LNVIAQSFTNTPGASSTTIPLSPTPQPASSTPQPGLSANGKGTLPGSTQAAITANPTPTQIMATSSPVPTTPVTISQAATKVVAVLAARKAQSNGLGLNGSIVAYLVFIVLVLLLLGAIIVLALRHRA
jgi:hypothetical protein